MISWFQRFAFTNSTCAATPWKKKKASNDNNDDDGDDDDNDDNNDATKLATKLENIATVGLYKLTHGLRAPGFNP